MTTELEMLQAVLYNPEDDAPRLIYADWLEEQGRDERAEFIRVQCRLAEHEVPGPKGPPTTKCICGACCSLRLAEAELLTLRQRGSCTGHPSANTFTDARYVWAGPVAVLPDPDGNGWEFRRGFVHAVTCTAEDWLRHGNAICAPDPLPAPDKFLASWQPIEEVMLTTIPHFETDGVYHGLEKRWPRVRRWHLLPPNRRGDNGNHPE